MSNQPQTPSVPGPSARPRMGWRAPAGLAALVLVAGGVWQRERGYVWYCATRLERAPTDQKADWAASIASRGSVAAPTLLGLLRSDDPAVCQAARDGFDLLWKATPEGDATRSQLVSDFFEAEPRFSTPGRAAGLDLLPSLLVWSCGWWWLWCVGCPACLAVLLVVCLSVAFVLVAVWWWCFAPCLPRFRCGRPHDLFIVFAHWHHPSCAVMLMV